MKSAMALNGMLLCRDLQLLCVMNRILDDLDIETSLFMNDALAVSTISERLLDCAILDWDAQTPAIIEALRTSELNRDCFAIALVNSAAEMEAAFRAGATLSMQKPLTPDHARRCMQAAYGSIIRQRRSAFRELVRISVEVKTENRLFRAEILDLSISGLRLQSDAAMKVRDLLHMAFPLPGSDEVVSTLGRIVWTKHNKAGLKFSVVRPHSYIALKEHLEASENRRGMCNVIVPSDVPLPFVVPHAVQTALQAANS
jgi:CheY-like chemotaxis protein